MTLQKSQIKWMRYKTYLTIIAVAVMINVTLLRLTTGKALAQGAPDAEPQGGLFLPYVQNGNAEEEKPQFPFETVATDAGSCPSDFHLVNTIGAFTVIDVDTDDATTDWSEYGCRANETLESAACGEHGTALMMGGNAACSCSEGYVGAQCNVCAWGFAQDPATGQCKPQAPIAPAAQIVGGEQSVEQGETVQLIAVPAAGNEPVASAEIAQNGVKGTWSIVGGEGCLLATRDAAACLPQVVGTQAFFRAPLGVAPVSMTTFQFTPECCADAPVVQTVIVQPPGTIPVTGWGSPALQPLLQEVMEYMVEHCVGAGVVGVSYYGKPVGIWGLGKNYGRASSAILDPACGDNATDPHYPAAPNITTQTPMQLGSVSKIITFSVARWAFKERLQELDTDVVTVALSDKRLVTAIRTTDNVLQIDSWGIHSGGITSKVESEQGGVVRDFALARISETRVLVGVRTQDNNLKMIVWDVNDGGQLQRLGEATGGQIKQVTLTSIGNNRVVSAVREGDDTLKLIVWHVAPDGSVSRLGEATAGRAREVDIAGLSSAQGARVVTSVRTDDHALKLIVWDVNNAGEITRRGDDEEPGTIDGLRVRALSPERVVVAIRTDAGNLKVIIWSITADGNPQRKGDDEGGEASIFALSPIGPSGFAASVRSQAGDFKLISWTVDDEGEPTRRDDDEAGPVSSMSLANVIYGGETLQSVVFAALRTAASQLKLIAWDVTAPTPVRLADEGIGDSIVDYSWSDADVEAMKLFGYDIPEGLLPDRLHRLFSGQTPAPILLSAGDSCPAPAQFADPQWQQITLKHLFGHRTGMPKSAYGDDDLVKNYLDVLRGLDSQADYAAQEQLMRDIWGDANIEFSRQSLGWNTAFVVDGETDGYIVPFVTLEEVLVAVAGRCLPKDLSAGNYSNTTPQIMMTIIEHISDRRYVAQAGYPETHEGSLVDLFMAQAGIETGPVAGIFARPSAVTTALDDIYPGPLGREWKNGTYYPMVGDRKRPHCVWSDGVCSFSEWGSGAPRLTWGGHNALLPTILAGNGFGAATGGMTVEPGEFLTFMSQYWAAGYDGDKPEADFNPWVGEPRNNVWNIDSHHNGSVGGGGIARADQIADDTLGIYGVDVFTAFNQNENKRCVENADAPGCDDNLYFDVVKKAVDEIDWDEVFQDGLQLVP